MIRDEKVDLLAGMRTAEACTRAQLREIARHSDVVTASPGNVLVREGAPAYEVFLIVRGEAEISHGGRPVAVCGPGDYVGEVGVLSRQARDAQVTARTPMTLLVFSAREFLGLMASIRPLNRGVLGGLASRLRESDLAAAG